LARVFKAVLDSPKYTRKCSSAVNKGQRDNKPGLGIFFLPWYFSWFTLRKGHSALARLVSFGWLSVIVLSWIAVSPTTEPRKNYAAPDVTASPAPTSTASRKSSSSTPGPSEAKPFETESQRKIFATSFIKPVLKGMLNDPDSLDDLSITSVNPINRNPGAYKITVSYRAKNGFGAVMAQQQQFVVTKGTGSGLEGLWNVTPVN
jgi:cytoskeletal protein RodZ